MNAPAYLEEFTYRAAAVLGGHVDASITLQHHGVNVRAASSGPEAARCDQAEALADAGPCILAMDEMRAHLVPDLATETRWRSWCRLATQMGFQSMLAMPAAVSPTMVLALNLYSRRQDPWDAAMIGAADAYAQLAAGMVGLRLRLASLEDATAGVYSLLRDEQVVDHAVISVMRSNACTEQQARAILREASAVRDVSPREVAEGVLQVLSGADPVT